MKHIRPQRKPNSDFKFTAARKEQMERRVLQMNWRQTININFIWNTLQTIKITISATSANFWRCIQSYPNSA